MSDLRGLIVLHFNVVSARSISSGDSRTTACRVNLYRTRLSDGGIPAVSPTGLGLADLARLGPEIWCKESDIEFDEIRDAPRENWLWHWTRRAQLFDEYSNLTLDSRPTNAEKFMDFRLLSRENG